MHALNHFNCWQPKTDHNVPKNKKGSCSEIFFKGHTHTKVFVCLYVLCGTETFVCLYVLCGAEN